MRAYVKDGRLHIVAHGYSPVVGDLPEEELVFDENYTAAMRLAFYQELDEEVGGHM